MAIAYPGIGYLRGYNTNPDLVGKFAQGFDFGKGIKDEAAAPAAIEQSAQSLREFGLPENIGELMSNQNTRDIGIAAWKAAAQRRDEASDPLRQLQLRKAQMDLSQAGSGPAPTAEMRNFQMAQQDPKFLEFIGAKGAAKAPADVQEYLWFREEEKAAGREPMPYLDFVQAQKSGSGMSVTTPDGTTVQVGGGMPKLTEGQSKDVVYFTRGAGSLPVLDKFGGALTSVMEQAMDVDPTGLVRGNQSPEFQQAKQAGREFLQAILRKDTGAAITSQEMDSYGKTYLPSPGDGPELLEQKRGARRRALQALQNGIPSAAILTLEQQGITVPPEQAAPAETAPGGVPEGVDPELWPLMTPEEQALWQN